MKVEFFPAAEIELIEAAQYYESRFSGLGMDLILEVERVVAVLFEIPSLGEKLDRVHRRIPLRRFPYGMSSDAMEMSFASSLLRTVAASRVTGTLAYRIDRRCKRRSPRRHLMLSYAYFGTNDLERAIGFYNAALGALGMRRVITNDPAWDHVSAGWGMYEDDGVRELAFWIGKPFDQQPASVGNGSMVAFRARSWHEVDDFYAAALAHGGKSDGPPGLRLHYNRDFYAAYVRDPDGNKICALCRGFTERQ